MNQYTAGTHMSQDDYLKLEEDCKRTGTRFSEAEIKGWINKNFGFEFSRIELKTIAETFHSEGHRIIKTEVYLREPCYSATDWNYARFDVVGNQWEIVNGELYFYED